jgi:hypothetical protein
MVDAAVAGRDRLAFLVAIASLIGVNSPALFYFSETRPDMDALFFAAGAVIILYRGLESKERRPRWKLVVCGSLFTTVASLFKQNALVFAFVPALAIHFGAPRTSRTGSMLIAAGIPIAGVLAAFVAIRSLSPGLWHFLVVVPSQYRYSLAKAARFAVNLVYRLPMFLLAFIQWLITEVRGGDLSPKGRWLMASCYAHFPLP